MSDEKPKEKKRKKVNLLTLFAKKRKEEQVVYITAYDYPLALLADRAGVDMILVGDSLGMTTLGYETTIPVTMDDMIRHSQAVTRANKYAFVVGDMPYMSYQVSDESAIRNAGRFIQEANCDAVKCEGGRRVASRIRAMVDSGTVVMGHLGLTPQNMAQFGGYKVQGKTKESFDALLDDAKAIEDAGASFLLLEAIPSETAGKIKEALSIPVYGIGAGDQMDGQLVIIHDMIGLFEQFQPKFVKRYCEAGSLISLALRAYCDDVRQGRFPKPEHFYDIKDEEKEKILRS
jgi:3-methyl-2-oxobutanoate hydroxymethyltransferase